MAIDQVSVNSGNNFTVEHIVLIQGDTGYDISGIVTLMEISESIDDGLLEGYVEFVDSMSLMETLVFRGDEHIRVSFYSKTAGGVPNQKYVKMFRVNRFEAADSPSTRNKKFVRLNFNSMGEVNNEFIKVSKSYSNVGMHEIVADMLKLIGYSEHDYLIEKTLYNRDIVIPNITPLEVITHLASNAVSASENAKGDSNFYFFENCAAINFVSGTTLMNVEPVAELIFEGDSSILMYNRLFQFAIVRGYNIQDQARHGGLGSMIHSHSLVNKSYKSVYMADTTVKQTYPMMNSIKWYGGDLTSNRMSNQEFRPEDQMYKFLNMGSAGNSAAIRNVNRTMLNAKRAVGQMAGNTDIMCGSTVNIKIPVPTGRPSAPDAGVWLVSKIRHIITRSSYTMALEFITDSSTV